MDALRFKGGGQIKVDGKGRMAMPSKYRQALQTHCQGRLVVTASGEECLWLYPYPQWLEVEAQLLALPNMREEVRSLQRLLVGYATECEMDANGRFLLTPMLREFAGIDRQAVLIGQGNKFELWGSRHWELQVDRSKKQAKRLEGSSELPDGFGNLRL